MEAVYAAKAKSGTEIVLCPEGIVKEPPGRNQQSLGETVRGDEGLPYSVIATIIL